MRILAFILLCGVMFGLSGCGNVMIGDNRYEEFATRMPEKGDGLLNEDASKYYWGDIRITTIPAGLEVELYNNGKPAVPRTYQAKRWETETVGTVKQDGVGYTVCMQSWANIKNNGVDVSYEAADADCRKDGIITETTFATGTYIFNEGLKDKTTPTTARLYARTPENDASKYVLVFKKNGKEITRREIKTHINWWVYADLPMAMPTALITLLSFPFEMAWLNFRTKDAHYAQTRSYLTQGDIEIDLTEEIKKLGL